MPAVNDPISIPWPLSTFPGANPQESAGRLINCYAEQLGEAQRPTGPAPQVWRRCPGLSLHAQTAQTGYRGGLIVNNLSYEAFLNEALTVDINGNVALLGAFPGTKKVSIARNQASNSDVVAVDLDNGAYILNTSALVNATVQATVAGAAFNAGDTVSLTFVNSSVTGLPITVLYTVVGGDTATTVATALTNLINANATLAAANISAASALGVLTISQQGAIGNNTMLLGVVTGTGSETVTFNPASGQMSGGTGTPGIVFAGAPLAYNGGGNLPQPNSVCFQDGYLFFTTGSSRCYATALNSLSLNALTYITVQSRQDVTLLRGIAFSGMLLLFTTGSLEFWADNANPAPNFPYARLLVVDYGLVQPTAIAGWETGFGVLLWAAQDFGVYALPGQSTQPVKVSSPDIERAIEAAVRAGVTLEAGCYSFAGKKFWVLSSPTWSFEVNITNIGAPKWNERWSLAGGVYGRWRGTLGHPAFGKWLTGDQQTGNLLWVDSGNHTEMGAPQLMRLESGPVKAFPAQIRVARGDFDFDMGVGIAVANFQMIVNGAVSGTGGVVRLSVNDTSQAKTNDQANVSGITGTTEANGTWPITVIDASHIELQGSVFQNAYVSGGLAIDVTPTPNAVKPVCAISRSLNGGLTWGNPLVRSLGPQGNSKHYRASVKNLGLSGPMGDRWRVDITDPVYVGFMGGTQSSNPRQVGA
jgi:hypothetical protein